MCLKIVPEELHFCVNNSTIQIDKSKLFKLQSNYGKLNGNIKTNIGF